MTAIQLQYANVIERAYELARSGAYASSAEVKKRLKAEGYTGIDLHFSGSSLQKAIRQLCIASRFAIAATARTPRKNPDEVGL